MISYPHRLLQTCLYLTLFLAFNGHAEVTHQKELDAFIDKMVTEHDFERQQLEQLFQDVEIKQNILKAISSPAEGLSWSEYRKIFMTDSRINGGVRYWTENEKTLQQVEQDYGVPPEIIVAIIGVETRYGGNTGSHRIIDALSTLAFAYPKRSRFFSKELENFLLLCREEKIDPLEPTGSYAGAMGVPQFMPSSYRAYAADFDGDNYRDIWKNQDDVIASVANYFTLHKWQPGKAVTFPVRTETNNYNKALTSGLKPDQTIAKLNDLGIQTPDELAPETRVKLFEFTLEDGTELWIGLDNFYVITRYNHSRLYAMAVFQLSEAIRDKKQQI